MLGVCNMCQQLEILEKIREKVGQIEKDMGLVKKDIRVLLENQARQGGQIDLIVNRLNSPVEEERKDAIFWRQLKSIGRTTTGKIIIVLMIGSVALAGQRILELLGMIQ